MNGLLISDMSIIIRHPVMFTSVKVLSRGISSSSTLSIKQWRVERGLPINRNAEGILTDGPDFAYLDGRPTPMLFKQKMRMLRQQEYATRMVELCSELQFAKDRHQKMEMEKEQERQHIIRNRLKPKGNALSQKRK